MKKIAFIIPPTVELLDLAGPVQVFTEAKFYGFDIAIEFYAYQQKPVSTAGLAFGELANYKDARLNEGDLLFIPGMDCEYVRSKEFKYEHAYFAWIKECFQKNIIVCSVCNGAFALGEAGLLNNIKCTTHWRRTEELQTRFPAAKVLTDALFVKDGRIRTSAGISAGIDLALSILEDLKGPVFTHKVARGLVVYHRRSNNYQKESIYINYRKHINPMVHKIQDYLIENIANKNNIKLLAKLVDTSPRNLSRVFKEKTGVTILEYLTQLRLENANILLTNTDYTLDYIAAQCGFKTAKQLKRILKNKY
ncbi:helix-turn-helix domain-containing protein [Panacibacter ginsenosidivorans]|uniref:Helix-turn-helix domain-containing protein n=1 Tax=Panacibacter ginsenosidivorans TaxID=1813871 RepID=A0A5B8V414_9BACT|nr:DJ-1/PfpI family protein [Panacibacter ginsenosidivorans]QEC66140.1 helix-turn-helix domain-containing protein [Panacibacter ginsenosidivorans]